MQTINLRIQLEYDKSIMHGDDVEDWRWFLQDVLMGESGEALHLFSDLVGDIIGEVKVLGIGAITEDTPNG